MYGPPRLPQHHAEARADADLRFRQVLQGVAGRLNVNKLQQRADARAG